jgi:apolipoprotein N-acyltransferase
MAWGYGAWRERTLVLRDAGKIALVQPDIPFSEKWIQSQADSEVGLLLSLSREARAVTRPDLVIWPEAAVPGFLPDRSNWAAEISQFASESRTPIVTGGLNYRWRTDGTAEVFNAAFYFDSLGRWRDYPVYAKQALVPVVERVPFVPVAWFRAVPWLGKWSGGFGHGRELPLYPSGRSPDRFGVIICYESAFEDLPRRYRALGADFLVNVTNDAWYGRTAGPYQHATHLVLRAIETRMGVARAANSGISEFVDPLGRTAAASQLETRTVVSGHLMTSDAHTLYVRWGDWVGTLVMISVGVLAAALFARERLGWGRPEAAGGMP